MVHGSRLRVYNSQYSQARISDQKSSKRFDKKADKIMGFILKAGNMGHNRGSWLRVQVSTLTITLTLTGSPARRVKDL